MRRVILNTMLKSIVGIGILKYMFIYDRKRKRERAERNAINNFVLWSVNGDDFVGSVESNEGTRLIRNRTFYSPAKNMAIYYNSDGNLSIRKFDQAHKEFYTKELYCNGTTKTYYSDLTDRIFIYIDGEVAPRYNQVSTGYDEF